MNPRVWSLFGKLLEYPEHHIVETVDECIRVTDGVSSEAAAILRSFREFVADTSLGRLQEEYTRSFDMEEAHSLYVGFHLLGESYKRSAFLVELHDRYRPYDIDLGSELGDHIPIMLRFLAVCEDPEIGSEIIGDALWPALRKITTRPAREEDLEEGPPKEALPYHSLLDALTLVVGELPEARLEEEEPALVTASTTPLGWPTVRRT